METANGTKRLLANKVLAQHIAKVLCVATPLPGDVAIVIDSYSQEQVGRWFVATLEAGIIMSTAAAKLAGAFEAMSGLEHGECVKMIATELESEGMDPDIVQQWLNQVDP